ncbi:UPF0235 protein C15orf40 homolog isoform X2 [Arvicanthis niloticus]|uniref:UPF0235 protein C15orf40 homolog isoform X2 n=1 Tax=Arvicanthis niloticus TaxID=61156 RepID=UPI001486B3BB|nr:UPF0235 protein C15orf40 homolog isoform X1 [Arvicanthis niloticus]
MLLLAAGRCAWPLLDSCVVPQCLRKPVLQARPVASLVMWRGWATGLHWRGTEAAPGGRKTSLRVQGKNQAKEPETPPPPAGPVATDPKGFVTIAIHAKPGSKQNAVTDLSTEAVGVAIAAPPSEGEANAELCRYLSKVLDLRKSDVVLDKGGKSREKVVKLLASTTPEEVLEKLKTEAERK